jgi:hypothetical protein
MNYHTQDKHTNHYNTDVVNKNIEHLTYHGLM